MKATMILIGLAILLVGGIVGGIGLYIAHGWLMAISTLILIAGAVFVFSNLN